MSIPRFALCCFTLAFLLAFGTACAPEYGDTESEFFRSDPAPADTADVSAGQPSLPLPPPVRG